MLTSVKAVVGRAIGRRVANHVVAPRLHSSILSIVSPRVKFSLNSGSKAAFATAAEISSETKYRSTKRGPGTTTRKGQGKTKRTASKRKPAAKKNATRHKAKPKTKSATKKAKQAKIEYTKPPKRPLTPYMLYLRDQSAGTTQQSMGGSIELIKQVAQRWRHMTPQGKLPYERRFAEAREKYVLEREAWLKSLSPTGLRQYRSAVRKRRSRYRLKDASGQPLKRAPSAWNIFLRDSMASKPKSGEKIGVQLAAIAAEWRQLNGSEKADYATRAEGGKLAYRQARDKQRDEARTKFYRVHNLNA